MARNRWLIMVILAVFLATGCWSKKEVEKLAIVSAVGVDRTEIDGMKKWQISLEIFHPHVLAPSGGNGEAGGGQLSAAWVATSIGDTLDDAINNLSSRSPRILFFAHNSIIVIGKEAAEQENLADILAFFFSEREMRLRNWLLIADGRAVEVLAAQWEMEQDIAREIEGLIERTRERLSKAEVCNLKDVGEALASTGKDVITGRLGIFPTPEPLKKQTNGQGFQKESVRLDGASVFSKGKLVGWFDDIETRGYLLIAGKAKTTVMPLQLGQGGELDASTRIVKMSSKIIPEILGGEARIKVVIKAEGHLNELFPGKFTVDADFMNGVGKKVAAQLKEEALMSVAKAQSYRADVFGFGQAIHRKYPRYWKEISEDWRDYFVSLPVEVEVDFKMRRTEMFLEPVPSR